MLNKIYAFCDKHWPAIKPHDRIKVVADHCALINREYKTNGYEAVKRLGEKLGDPLRANLRWCEPYYKWMCETSWPYRYAINNGYFHPFCKKTFRRKIFIWVVRKCQTSKPNPC